MKVTFTIHLKIFKSCSFFFVLQTVYIGVQGQTDRDRFTILVWDQLFDPVDAFIDVIEGAHRGETIYEVNRNLTSAVSRNT